MPIDEPTWASNRKALGEQADIHQLLRRIESLEIAHDHLAAAVAGIDSAMRDYSNKMAIKDGHHSIEFNALSTVHNAMILSLSEKLGLDFYGEVAPSACEQAVRDLREAWAIINEAREPTEYEKAVETACIERIWALKKAALNTAAKTREAQP